MASFNPVKIANKQRRQAHYLREKKQKEASKREERFRRKKKEDQDPELRNRRRTANVPVTIESKRRWDEVDSGDEDDGRLGLSVDILEPKRRKVDRNEPLNLAEAKGGRGEGSGRNSRERRSGQANNDDAEGNALSEGRVELDDDAEERDSMLDTDSEHSDNQDDDNDDEADGSIAIEPPPRQSSEAPSTATDLTVRPEALKARFPTLFEPSNNAPKVLITTSINSTLHAEAKLLTNLFPNSTYIRRTAHFHSYKYSIREICSYASTPSQAYTHVVVLSEDQKKPRRLDIVHLPHGPMFHFTLSNWIPGARLPGHGNPTDHVPELILGGFRTPMGLLTAQLFKSLYPPQPELQGRQVVTLHNQRDYIFVRRHRYVFRDRRATEKAIQGADGKPMAGAEEIRAGLQELGPRFTMKLRRIDRGIQRASGQEWEWKAHEEKVRTRFNL